MPAPVSRRQAAPVESVLSVIRSMRPAMGEVTGRAADLILEHPEEVMGLSLTEFAERVDASEGLVIRLCQQIGVSGLQQLKISLAQELVKPIQFIHEDLEPGDDVATVIRKTFQANIAALQDTLTILKPDEMARAVEIINAADRVELYGIGSAAPIAEDAHYRMMRIGLTTRVTVDSHLQAVSASLADERTAVLTVSHSGSTRETLAAMRLAKEAGARTICITGFKKSPIQKYSDVVLQTMARETTFRTEAMTSRIAQLAIVDALVAALALTRHDVAVKTIRHTFDVLSEKRF
jgi:DNA-binding MurR/RpiR family transcriptional regulator